MNRSRRGLLGVAGRMALASALLSYAAPAVGADRAPAIAGSEPAVPVPLADADELILELRTRDFVLSDGLLAYRLAGRSYLPLGELSRALQFAIAVDSAAGRAAGWYLSEDRTFALDIARRSVTIAGRLQNFSDQDVRLHEGEIYVEAGLLAQWFPLGLQVDLSSLEARLTTREPFPFEARAARERLRARLGDDAAGPATWDREETPFELVTPPSIDLAVGATYRDGRTRGLEHQTRASGDLLFMNANLYLRGDGVDPIADARFVLERKDPDGDLPLGMTHVAVGDTYSTGLPLGLRSDFGRGVYLTNAPLGQASVFSRTDVGGEVAQGHDVELFRNGVLIASQRESNGQYLFADVPLVFGRNELRLVFNGPRGERREELRVVQIGDSRLGAGESRFAASVMERRRSLVEAAAPGGSRGGEGHWMGAAYGEYGLNDSLTLAAGSALVAEPGHRRGLLLGGLRSGIAGAAVAVDGAMWTTGGAAVQFGLAGESHGVSYALTHAEYTGGFVDETRPDPEALYRRSTELRMDGLIDYPLPGGSAGALATSLVASFDVHADGRRRANAVLRTGASLGGWVLSNALDYALEEGAGGARPRNSLRGSLDAATIFRGSAVRARLDYAPGGDRLVTAAGFQVDRSIGADMRARIDLSHDFTGEGGTSGGFAVSREFETFDLALSGRYGDRDGLALGLRFTTSLGWSPGRRSWFQARPGLAKGGAVEALVFRDRNGDGVRQTGEEPVADAAIASSGRSAVTDARGVARLGGLAEARPALVRVSPGSLADPFAAPARAAFEITPRPGRIHAVEIAIVTAGEIEGVVRLADHAGGRAMAGLTLQLLDEAGNPAGEARTEYDGFYVIQGVRPGRYALRIDPEEARRYGLAATSTRPVTVEPAGGVVSGMDFIIG